MATQLFLGYRSASDYGTGNNDPRLSGVASGWAPYWLGTSRDIGSQKSGLVPTVTGPTNGHENEDRFGTGTTMPMVWYSDPLAAAVTISGSITWNLWALESSMSANAAANGIIEVVDGATGAVTLIDKTARTVEMQTTNTAENFAETPAVGVLCKKGDRLRVRIFADDSAAATMASGFTFSFALGNQTAGGQGDSWVQLTENLTFAINPTGSQVFLTDTSVSTTPSLTAPLLTSFTGADENPLSEGGNWLALNSVVSGLSRVGNAAKGATSANRGSYYNVNYGPDLFAHITIVTAPTAGSSIIFAARVVGEGGTSTWDGYGVYMTATVAYLVRVTNSAVTTLGTASAIASGDKVGIQCSGSTISFWLFPSGGSAWTRVLTATDATYTAAGKLAIQIQSSASNEPVVDDLSVGSEVPISTVTREAWTSRGGSSTSASADTVTGWTAPIPVTSGGTAIEWYTKPLTAFTLGGAVRCSIWAIEWGATVNAAIRVEIARVENDGSSPTAWASGTRPTEVQDSIYSANSFLISGDDLAITNGQRLRIRVYADDSAAAAMGAATPGVSVYYNGPTGDRDTFLTFSQTFTEFVSGPGPQSRTATDALGMGDAATRQLVAGRTVSDARTMSDVATAVVTPAGGPVNRTATDARGMADSATRQVVSGRTASSARGTADAATRQVGSNRLTSDSLTTVDVATRLLALWRTAPPGSAFVPSSLSGLAAHLDASTLGLADGATITSWPNLSGGASASIVSSPGPTMVAPGLNGLPVARFLQNSGRLRMSGTGADKDFTLVYVARSIAPHTAGRVHSTSYPTANMGIGFWHTYMDIGVDANPTTWEFTPNLSIAKNAEWRLYSGDGTASAPARLFKDGVYLSQSVTATTTGLGGFLYLNGLDATNGDETTNCEVAEVVLYDRRLSDAERQQVEGYLRYKWFGIGTPPGGTDNLAMTDVATFSMASLPKDRTATDALTMVDAAARQVTASRTAADNLGAADAAVRAVARTRTASDARGAADVATRNVAYGRLATDALAALDLATRVVARLRTAVDTLSALDVATRAVVTLRAAQDGRGAVDTATRSLAAQRDAQDALGAVDVAVRIVGPSRAAVDTLSAVDVATRQVNTSRSAQENLTMADSALASKFGIVARTAADALGMSDLASRVVVLARASTDARGLADAATRALNALRSSTDGRGAADVATRSGTYARSANENLGMSDNAVGSKFGIVARTAVDALGMADLATRAVVLGRSVADARGLADIASRALSTARSATDARGLADLATRSLASVRSAQDALGASDEAVWSKFGVVMRTASEAISRVDNATRTVVLSRAASETLTAIDVATKASVGIVARTTSDALGAVDQAVRSLASVRSANESRTQADVATRAVVLGRSATDGRTASDEATRATITFRTAQDARGAADAAVASRTYERSAQDARSATDVVTTQRVFGRASTDGRTMSDVATRRVVLWRVVTDARTMVDVATRRVVGATIRAVVTSAVSLATRVQTSESSSAESTSGTIVTITLAETPVVTVSESRAQVQVSDE